MSDVRRGDRNDLGAIAWRRDTQRTPAPEEREGEIDQQVMGMARGASLNLAGVLCTKLTFLAITLILSRALGSSAFGRYAQAYALFMLLVMLVQLPFGSGTTRFVALYRAEGDDGALRGVVRLGVGLTSILAVVLAALLGLVAPWLAGTVFDDPLLETPLRLVALALPAACLAEASLLATMGFRRMRARALIKLTFEPLLRVAGIVVLVALGLGLSSAMLALVLSTWAEAVLAVRALRRYMARTSGTPTYHLRQLSTFSVAIGGASLAATGLLWADTVILGVFRSSSEVGVYTVATRIVALATFVMPAITKAFAPRITDLYQRQQTERLHHAYRVATGWSLRLSLPAFALLLAFPQDLLRLIGPAFPVAAAATVILAAGQLINVTTGPSGMMLNMSGRPGWSLANNIAALVLNVGLNLWLIPAYGVLGAAVAWTISLSLVNLARVAQVGIIMRMTPFHLGQLRALLAGALAMAAGTLAAHWLATPLRLFVGGSVLFLVYVAAISVLQFSEEDKVIVGMLARRARIVLRLHGARRGET